MPYIRSALGDCSGQKHSSSACWKLPHTWGILGESSSSSRLPDTSSLPRAEAGSTWRQHCPCWPRWAALWRSEDDIPPESFCALFSSFLSKVGVTVSAQSVVCINKTANWSCLSSEEIHFSVWEGFTWPATFSAGTDASLCQLWFVSWEGGSQCSRQKSEITNLIYRTPHKLSGGIILHCSWPVMSRLEQFWGSSQVSAIHSPSMYTVFIVYLFKVLRVGKLIFTIKYM